MKFGFKPIQAKKGETSNCVQFLDILFQAMKIINKKRLLRKNGLAGRFPCVRCDFNQILVEGQVVKKQNPSKSMLSQAFDLSYKLTGFVVSQVLTLSKYKLFHLQSFLYFSPS